MRLLLLIFFAGVSLHSVAQSLTVAPSKTGVAETEIPTPVRDAFKKENPQLTPVWKVDGGLFKATFVDPATNLGNVLIYQGSGEVLRREREMEASEIPQPVKEFYSKNFPGEGFVLWSRVDNAFMQTYYAHRNTRVLTFDKDGNYIGPKTDTTKPEEKIRIYGAQSE
jgi:hypothetical protein